MNKQVNIRPKGIIFLFFLFVFLDASLNNAFCQKNDDALFKRNSIFANFTTKGALYSVNYERIIHEYKTINLSGQFGFSLLKDAIAFPFGINLFTGKGNSHFDFSLILVPYIDKYKSFLSKNDLSDKQMYVVPGLGYRFQKPSGGFFFKMSGSPTIFLDPPSSDFWKMDPKLFFVANLGIGLSF